MHVLRSIEGGFIPPPNAYTQMFDLFGHYFTFIYPSWDILGFDVFGVRWSVFVNQA